MEGQKSLRLHKIFLHLCLEVKNRIDLKQHDDRIHIFVGELCLMNDVSWAFDKTNSIANHIVYNYRYCCIFILQYLYNKV